MLIVLANLALNARITTGLLALACGIGIFMLSGEGARETQKRLARRGAAEPRPWWDPVLSYRQVLLAYRAIGVLSLALAAYEGAAWVLHG